MSKTTSQPPNLPPRKTFDIYLRVSDPRDKKTASLESQEAACRKKLTALGVSVGDVLTEKQTSQDFWERPLLSAVREKVRRGERQGVIAYSQDRLARDPIHIGLLKEEFDRRGAEILLVQGEIGDSLEAEMVMLVKGIASKMERAAITERAMRSKLHRLRQGKIHGFGRELYGYVRDKKAGKRLINDEQARIVKQIFEWYVEGFGMHTIAKKLNEQGVPSPYGKRWLNRVIQNIVRNPEYKGVTVCNKISHHRDPKTRERVVRLKDVSEQVLMPTDTTPAIVSEEVWARAQQRRAENRGDNLRNEKRFALLRGMVVCGKCGRKLYRMTRTRDQASVYRCSSLYLDDKTCGLGVIEGESLEEWAWRQALRIIANPQIIAEELKKRQSRELDPSLITDLASAKKHATKIAEQQTNLVRRLALVPDDLVPAIQRELFQLSNQKADYERAIERIETLIAHHKSLQFDADRIMSRALQFARGVRGLTPEQKRHVLQLLRLEVKVSGKTPAERSASMNVEVTTTSTRITQRRAA